MSSHDKRMTRGWSDTVSHNAACGPQTIEGASLFWRQIFRSRRQNLHPRSDKIFVIISISCLRIKDENFFRGFIGDNRGRTDGWRDTSNKIVWINVGVKLVET